MKILKAILYLLGLPFRALIMAAVTPVFAIVQVLWLVVAVIAFALEDSFQPAIMWWAGVKWVIFP